MEWILGIGGYFLFCLGICSFLNVCARLDDEFGFGDTPTGTVEDYRIPIAIA